MIKLKVEVKDLDSQIIIIQGFLTNKNMMSNKIAKHFNLNDIWDMVEEDKNKLIKDKITKLYAFKLKDMKEKAEHLQKVWDEKQQFINDEFVKIFGREFNYECKCYVNLNPVYPRYLKEKSFDVNVDASDEEFLSASAHEMTHFAWFEVWKENFPNTKRRDMERPRKPWLISEIVVDPIFHFSGLKTLSKYKPAYSYFYKENLGDRNLIELVRELYQGKILWNFKRNE